MEFVGADRAMLSALAVIALEVFDGLVGLTAILIDCNLNAPAWRGQCAREQAAEFGFEVKDAGLFGGEEFSLEIKPLSHFTALDVMGQMVQIVKAHAKRSGAGQPVEIRVIGVTAPRYWLMKQINDPPMPRIAGRSSSLLPL